MTFAHRDFEPNKTIDWDKDFIWIQDTSLLQIVSNDPGSPKLEVRRHNGDVVQLDRKTATTSYFLIKEGTCLKPVYAPIKAHVLGEPLVLPAHENADTLPAGSAIVQMADAQLGYILKDVLARDYEAVQYPSDPTYPDMPFSR